MTPVFLPLSATGSSLDGWERCYLSNSEALTIKQNTPIAAPLPCQTTAKSRKSAASPARRLFSDRIRGQFVSEGL